MGNAFKNSFTSLRSYWSNLDKKTTLKNNALTISMLLFVLIVIIYDPSFLSVSQIFLLANRMGSTLLMALGMACIMIVGGTDLSAGRASGLIGMVCASLLQRSGLTNEVFVGLGHVPIILPFLLAIVIGVLISVINALCIIKFKLHPFIMTLATSMVIAGIVYWYMQLGTNNNASISVSPDTDYYQLINGGIRLDGAKLRYYVFFSIMIVCAMWVIWNKTTIGRHMYAVGGNREAAEVCGISIMWVTVIVFAIAGACFGLTGFINGATDSQNIDFGVGLDLDAIAACIIGGVSFVGGVGKIRGVIFGVFLIQFLQLSLRNVFNVGSTQYTSLISGLIIIIAVAIDMRKSKAKK